MKCSESQEIILEYYSHIGLFKLLQNYIYLQKIVIFTSSLINPNYTNLRFIVREMYLRFTDGHDSR